MKSDTSSYCGMFGQKEKERAKMMRKCMCISWWKGERDEKSNNNGAWWLVIGKIMMPV